ncbi:hypothetical protein BGZ49_005290 [Haplosporangium sp. Z 27]|nr:hypothetical protein BGZ49_005290 [Haplosporangium sp. Z 27]
MLEILLSLDINNIPDSEDELAYEDESADEDESVDVDESADEDYDDEWYEPIDAQDIPSDQDAEDEELDDYDIQWDEGGDSELETSEAPSEDHLSDAISNPSHEDDQPVTEIKKKKRKKRNKKKRNYPSADDDLADINGLVPPISDGLYDLSDSVDLRFRLAMDNFRSERSFVPFTNRILETYFTYGGMGTHAENDPDTEVDFAYVVSSFLSSFIFETSIWYDEGYFQLAPRVISAFLKYVRDRDVVPEYRGSIDEAIKILEMAKDEVPKCRAFNALMPDDIGTTCSALFLPEYLSEQLPEDSMKLMELVIGIRSADQAQVKEKDFQYTRVSEIIANEEAGSDTALVKLVLEDMEEEGPSGLFPMGQGRHIYVSSEAASNVQVGTVIWGTFYTLSNDFIFARPLVALPSYYIKQEEGIENDGDD